MPGQGTRAKGILAIPESLCPREESNGEPIAGLLHIMPQPGETEAGVESYSAGSLTPCLVIPLRIYEP